MVFLNVWCTHTGKYKPESPSLKIFRHWKIHNQNKANLWSMNFPSNWSKPLVFVFLYSERWNFLLCDTLMLTKHKEVRQEGISFHKKKNGLASLLLQRGIIWQIASNLKFPWEKKKIKKKNPERRRKATWTWGFAFHCFTAGRRRGSCRGVPYAVYSLKGRLE